MRTRLICLVLVLAGLAVHSSGCLALAVGAGAAGTVVYLTGDLESQEAYNINVVYDATRKAMDDLELSVIEGKTKKDALSAMVVARDAQDRRVAVRLEAMTEKATEVSIRIGVFGDEVKARLIYNQIAENLKASSPETAQAPASPPGSQPPTADAPDSPAPVEPAPNRPSSQESNPPAPDVASSPPVASPPGT